MKRVALLLALGILVVGTANASITPVLTGGPVAVGVAFEYHYTAALSPDESLDVTATNGVTCPGSGGNFVQCTPAGTFFTIYDIAGFESASAPAGWMITAQLLGATPSTVSLPDDPSIINVTFFYTGGVVAGPVTFAGFTINSSDDDTATGFFSDQATQSSSGETDQGFGSVTIPALAPTPEPGSLVLGFSGLLGLCAATRRRLRA